MEEVRKFIFAPGFSTAKKVDNISGRGVGMDVVRTDIAKIRGKIELESEIDTSKKIQPDNLCPCTTDSNFCHKGTGLKTNIRIPVNMAIMNGTIVDINRIKYILPTLQIKKIFSPSSEHWVSIKGIKSMIKMRDDIIPVLDVAQLFDLDKFSFEDCIIVVLEHDGNLIALPVSYIIAKREIVVKPLDEIFENLHYAAGASILGDGKVAIILDIEQLMNKGEENNGGSK